MLKVMCSEAANRRVIEVLAETGGAVSALTSEGAHRTTSTNSAVYRQRKGSSAESAPGHRRKRMGLMGLAILFLKLMVALLQLLEVAMKYFK